MHEAGTLDTNYMSESDLTPTGPQEKFLCPQRQAQVDEYLRSDEPRFRMQLSIDPCGATRRSRSDRPALGEAVFPRSISHASLLAFARRFWLSRWFGIHHR